MKRTFCIYIYIYTRAIPLTLKEVRFYCGLSVNAYRPYVGFFEEYWGVYRSNEKENSNYDMTQDIGENVENQRELRRHEIETGCMYESVKQLVLLGGSGRLSK